jgi:putative phosphoesterase
LLVGLLADVHANAAALASVCESARRSGVARLLVAGDLVGYYYAPDHVLDMLALWQWDAVGGNHETMLGRWCRGEDRPALIEKYGSGLAEAEHRLGTDTCLELAALPQIWRGAMDGRRVLMCHGTPWDPDAYAYPDDAAALDRMAATGEDLVIFGHTHYPVVRQVGTTIVVNPGSVGQPRDRDPRASWALWDTEVHAVRLVRTSYDSRELQAECRVRDPAVPFLVDVLTRR